MMKNLQKLAVYLCISLAMSLSVYGQQKNTGELSLSARQIAIVPIAAFAAKGDQDNLKNALDQGLEAGLTVNEIKEILVQLYAYAGFPRSLNAITTFQTVINTRKNKNVASIEGRKPGKVKFSSNKYQFGKDVQAKLTGRSANSTQDFVPVIDTFLKEHLFADIFGRDNLDFQSREIATISILASIGNAENQLRSHLSVGRNTGLTELQLREIANKLSASVGNEAGNSATKIIDIMFSRVNSPTDLTADQTLSIAPTFPKGDKVSGGNFSGDVWVNSLATINMTITNTSVGNVTFAPKSRTKWHRHPSGQILLVTDGIGYYQEKGQAVRLIRKGDVINCPPNIAHWHGSTPDSSMSHITLGFDNGKGRVEWLGSVTDEEYVLK
ncbi:carboxymuconolactone decarboxylase family protein [Mucilaginibacter angelicae]|uniref:Carboxymuconolactone decarboxylase family protein n=1 Tax=Mucilaginibacter angelicae TaxID=869718 RepID=A0ABV6LFE1_9SPHI